MHPLPGSNCTFRIVGTLAVVWAVSACGPKVEHRPCTNQVVGELVTSAAMFKLDVYPSTMHCVGNTVAANAGAPEESHTYLQGELIHLDIPPGLHTLVLTTYRDVAATRISGGSCAEENLTPGGQVCFDLPVTPISDACCNPVNGGCADGCVLTCDPGWGDCNNDPSDGCELNLATAGEKLCGTACINANSCCTDSDCMAGPTPAACYAGSCPAAGGACTYAEKPSATICGATCCNSIGGTCKSDCTITCTGTKGNCNGDVGDGCETDVNSAASDCGQCGRACLSGIGSGVGLPSCSQGLCTSLCEQGHANCSRPAAPAADDGCECATPDCCGTLCQVTHSNGFGQRYYDCLVMGVYTRDQAIKAATAYDPTGKILADQFAEDPNDPNTSLKAVCNSTKTSCPCWVWSASGNYATAVGHAFLKNDPPGPNNCFVPLSASGGPAWD